MWNVHKLLTGAALIMLVASCTDGREAGARQLLQEAQENIDNSRYHAAIENLDTLNSRYRDRTAERREALLLRARAMEGIALDSVEISSAELAQATLTLETLRPQFTHVAGPAGLPGYFLPDGTDSHIMGATNAQGRVDEDGFFYLVVNVYGSRPGIRAIRVADGADTYTSGEISELRVVDVASSQTASFAPEDVDGLPAWLADHSGASAMYVIVRRGNDIRISLTSALRREIVACGELAAAMQAQRRASIHREKYERMLATARDQIANLTPSASDQQQ